LHAAVQLTLKRTATAIAANLDGRLENSFHVLCTADLGMRK
jgi:hypothetical protein